MSDFTDTHRGRCKVCGKRYIIEEGKDCICWKCEECGEWFSDHDMLGNEKEWLCLVCEDVRYQEELIEVEKAKSVAEAEAFDKWQFEMENGRR